MLRRFSSAIIVISALLFAGTMAMWYRSGSRRDAVSWTSSAGKLREVSFEDGVCVMGAEAEKPRLKMLTGWGMMAPKFFADTAEIRNLEVERDVFEHIHIIALSMQDVGMPNDIRDDVPFAKRQFSYLIVQEKLGIGPRRTNNIPGEYSEAGFLGIYGGSGMAGTLNIPPENINHPDRVAGAAIARVHLSLIRIRFPLLALLTGALPFIRLTSVTRRSLVRAYRRRRNRCPGCGYDLRTSPQRCPECGEHNSVNPTPFHVS